MLYDIVDNFAQEHLSRVRIKADYVAAACPFHKGGQERSPSFWIARSSGTWGCFTCPEKGDFGELMRRLGVRDAKVTAILAKAKEEGKKTLVLEQARRKVKAKAKFGGEHVLPESLLGVYDYCPESLLAEGFTEETLDQHNVGFDAARQRITFPIRDFQGNLIGISGRSTDGSEPKYKVYQGWHINWLNERVPGELGEAFPDYSSTNIRDHLWRMHFIYKELFEGHDQELIVVEGYKAAMWLVQNGFPNTVALMGSKMSPNQERMIRKLGPSVWILLDNNEAGREGTKNIIQRLGDSSFPVYRCWYPSHCEDSAQPDDLDAQELTSTLKSAERVVRKLHGIRRFVS